MFKEAEDSFSYYMKYMKCVITGVLGIIVEPNGDSRTTDMNVMKCTWGQV